MATKKKDTKSVVKKAPVKKKPTMKASVNTAGVKYILHMITTDKDFRKKYSSPKTRSLLLDGIKLKKAERTALENLDVEAFLGSIKHLKKIVGLAAVDETV